MTAAVRPTDGQRRTVPRVRLRWTWWASFVSVVVLAVGLGFVGCVVALGRTQRPVAVSVPWPVPTREQVNLIVWDLMARGEGSTVVGFYARFAREPERAVAFVSGALASYPAVPLNLALAVGSWEGLGGPGRSGPNQNGTYDWGDMGLNDGTYRSVSVSLLLDPKWNIPQGIRHLSEARTKASCWEAALAAYNGGSPDGVPGQKSFQYVAAVLWYERQYDLLFARRFAGEVEDLVRRNP